MKNKRCILALIAITLMVAAILTACSDNGKITSLTTKNDRLTVRLGGSVDISQYVETEGNGKLYYSVENSSVLSIDGSYVKAVGVGTGAVLISGGEFVVRIAISVIDDLSVTVTLANNEVTYDGGTYNIILNGNLPQNSTVKYYCCDEEFNGAINAGTYEVTAKITLPDGYTLIVPNETATLTIKKAQYDMSGVYFLARNFTYDGTPKTTLIGGDLPQGVTVSYENNTATEVGEYRAVAKFTISDAVNYEAVDDMICVFTIAKQFINLSQKGFATKKVTYNGLAQGMYLEELPLGTEVDYYYIKDNTSVALDNPLCFIDVGSYKYSITIKINKTINSRYAFVYGENVVTFTENQDGVPIATIEAVLTIEKANLISTAEWKATDKNDENVLTFVYGKSIDIGTKGDADYFIRYDGDLPTGANGELANKVSIIYSSLKINSFGNVDVGTYSVSAEYSIPEEYGKNYNVGYVQDFVLNIARASYDVSNVTFTSETQEVTFEEGAAYNFAAEISGDKDAFFEEVQIDYTYKLNGDEMGEYTAGCVYHAGIYEIKAAFTLLTDVANYNAIPAKTIRFTVKPFVVEINDITFADLTNVVYDGEAHGVSVNGTLPQFVTVQYTSGGVVANSFVNAGKYTVSANFYYHDREWWITDYTLKINGTERKTLYATIEIIKADYKNIDKSIYTQKTSLTYKKGIALSSVELNNNTDGYVTWASPEAVVEIGETVSGETYGYYSATALYNADKNNYNDYRFVIKLKIEQAVIDLSQVRVNNQFIGYTGKQAVPVLACNGTDCTALVNIALNDNAIEIGAYTLNVTLTPKAVKNYRFIGGDGEYNKIRIYIYNKTLYTYTAGTTSLEKYIGDGKSVMVPDGTTIVKQNAFDKTDVTSIILPDSITNLALYALGEVNSLKTLSMPSATYPNVNKVNRLFSDGIMPTSFSALIIRNDTVIADKTFQYLPTIKTITYEQDVTSIGNYAFDACEELELFGTHDMTKLETVGQSAFHGCSSLKKLTLPSLEDNKLDFYIEVGATYALEELTFFSTASYSFADSAFKGASGIKTFKFSAGLTQIGKGCFEGVTADIDLRETSVTTVGDFAFSSYAGKNILFNENTTAFGTKVFAGVENVERITIPKTVTTIGAYAFYKCTASIVFETGSEYKTIGQNVFSDYGGTDFDFSQFTNAGKGAFSNSKLTSASVDFDLPDNMFDGCSELSSITLGNKVTAIGAYCFRGCDQLTAITLPETITAIGSYAFKSCSNLTEITFMRNDPPSTATKVYETDGAIIIMVVPYERKEKYKTYFEACGAEGHYEFD